MQIVIVNRVSIIEKIVEGACNVEGKHISFKNVVKMHVCDVDI
jgi:hypothetical protein